MMIHSARRLGDVVDSDASGEAPDSGGRVTQPGGTGGVEGGAEGEADAPSAELLAGLLDRSLAGLLDSIAGRIARSIAALPGRRGRRGAVVVGLVVVRVRDLGMGRRGRGARRCEAQDGLASLRIVVGLRARLVLRGRDAGRARASGAGADRRGAGRDGGRRRGARVVGVEPVLVVEGERGVFHHGRELGLGSPGRVEQGGDCARPLAAVEGEPAVEAVVEAVEEATDEAAVDEAAVEVAVEDASMRASISARSTTPESMDTRSLGSRVWTRLSFEVLACADSIGTDRSVPGRVPARRMTGGTAGGLIDGTPPDEPGLGNGRLPGGAGGAGDLPIPSSVLVPGGVWGGGLAGDATPAGTGIGGGGKPGTVVIGYRGRSCCVEARPPMVDGPDDGGPPTVGGPDDRGPPTVGGPDDRGPPTVGGPDDRGLPTVAAPVCCEPPTVGGPSDSELLTVGGPEAMGPPTVSGLPAMPDAMPEDSGLPTVGGPEDSGPPTVGALDDEGAPKLSGPAPAGRLLTVAGPPPMVAGPWLGSSGRVYSSAGSARELGSRPNVGARRRSSSWAAGIGPVPMWSATTPDIGPR